MKAQYELAKLTVEKAVEEWKIRLNLTHLTIELRFLEAFKDDDDTMTVADTQTDWEYRHVVIRWFLPRIVSMTAEEIRHDVLHELVHTLTAAMESEVPARATKQAEYAVESLTLAILHAVDTACIADGSQKRSAP